MRGPLARVREGWGEGGRVPAKSFVSHEAFTMTRSYDVDCELNYDVHAPSTFIFKIEAALLPTQAVYNELLTIVPALPFG